LIRAVIRRDEGCSAMNGSQEDFVSDKRIARPQSVSGFQSRTARIASFALTNAAAASLAVATLSLCLFVALAALSIRVMAATPIAG
jgi:hypothetical protein